MPYVQSDPRGRLSLISVRSRRSTARESVNDGCLLARCVLRWQRLRHPRSRAVPPRADPVAPRPVPRPPRQDLRRVRDVGVGGALRLGVARG